MAPTPASTAKATYAVTLVIQCRFSCSSCCRPINLSSAWRFLSRLSVLMMRLRASMTSLRSWAISPVWDEMESARSEGGVDILEVLGSSLICIIPRQRLAARRASHAERFHASVFRANERGLGRLRVPFVVGLEEMEHQPQREQVASDVAPLLALRIARRAADDDPILDAHPHQRRQPQPQAERQVAAGRGGFVVDARGRAGVGQVPAPAA